MSNRKNNTKVNFSGVCCSHPNCSDGRQLLVRHILLCVVHMATRPSNLKRSATWESWEAWLSDPAATQAECMKKQGKKSNTHTHWNSPNPSVLFTVTCSESTWFQSSVPLLWQHLTQVKLILSGAGWVARAQAGRRWPGLQGMQLISIKLPLPLGVIRNELG